MTDESSQFSGARPKLLVVDDRPENLVALRPTLDELDVEVYEAHSGEEALTLTLAHEFCCVLLDVYMPGLNGMETAELLRKHRRTRHLPVIFVTAASSDDGMVSAAYRLGAADFVFKPISEDILRAKLGVFVDLERHRVQLNETLEQLTCSQRALENSQAELERSNAALRDFSHMAAHDLRTPLRHVIAGVDMLRSDGDAGDACVRTDVLDLVENSVRRMDGLIAALLRYSEVGRAALQISDCALDTILQTLVGELRSVPGGQDAEIVWSGLPRVSADPHLLALLLQNILVNAIKYRKSGQPAFVRIDAQTTEDGCTMTIADRGIGFENAAAERLFQPFVRMVSRSQNIEGSGIGLATARKIAELHGGRLTASGEPGQGAKFTIFLPAVVCTSAAA